MILFTNISRTGVNTFYKLINKFKRDYYTNLFAITKQNM